MDDVDFTVNSSDDGVDEDLPQRERRPWTPMQRVVAGVVGGAAVVAVGIAIATNGTSRPAAQPTSSARSTGSPTLREIPTVAPPTGLITRFEVPPDVITVDTNTGLVLCPRAGDGQSACQTTRTVPRPVVAALRAHFPGARVVSEINNVLRDTGYGSPGLWDRRISAVAGPIRISVLVRRPLPEDLTNSTDRVSGQRLIATESTGNNGFTVTVTVDAPTSHPSIFGSLDLLVSDSGLLVAG